MTEREQPCAATIPELAQRAREHYDEISTAACDWHSLIPKAIDAWEREQLALPTREPESAEEPRQRRPMSVNKEPHHLQRRERELQASLSAYMGDVGMMAGALFRIAQGVENPRACADSVLREIGAVDLADQAKGAVDEQ